jgi:hypothetical protein
MSNNKGEEENSYLTRWSIRNGKLMAVRES